VDPAATARVTTRVVMAAKARRDVRVAGIVASIPVFADID
jgi:hypothetical protein